MTDNLPPSRARPKWLIPVIVLLVLLLGGGAPSP